MENLIKLLLLWILFASTIVLPIFLARRGIGSRWTWLGGGIGGLLAFILLLYLWPMAQEPPSPDGVKFYPEPWDTSSLPLGGAERYCLFSALGCAIAGMCYKPRKKTETGLVGKT